MMDKKLKRARIKALRSRKYKQGRGTLETVNSNGSVTNCCLGVLCRVAGVRASKPNVNGDRKFDGSPCILSNKLKRRFKISVDEQDMLTGMNDGNKGAGIHPKRFPGIAIWIEKNL